MTPEDNPTPPCDVKQHLKNQGINLLAVIALATGTAIGVAVIKGLKWLVSSSESFREMAGSTIEVLFLATISGIILTLLGYALYTVFQPTIDLARCLYKARQSRPDR